MKARIYQFLILLLQFICGGLVVGFEWNFMAELVLIVLPFSVLEAILFTLYNNEIKKAMRYYIRVGEVPENETSKIYRGDTVIGEEEGVSVYNAVKIKDKWHIVMPTPFTMGQGDTYETLIQEVTECRFEIDRPRKVFLVTGDETGIGSDNEPLIKNVRIIQEITKQYLKQ